MTSPWGGAFSSARSLSVNISVGNFLLNQISSMLFSGVNAWLRDRYGRKFTHGLQFDDALTGFMWTFGQGIGKSSRRNMFPSWTWTDWHGKIEYCHYIDFYRGESRIIGPGQNNGPHPKAKIVRQAAIDPDHSETSVQKLQIVTDIRQFKLVIGPPKVTLNKSTEQYMYRLDKPDADEALRGELLHDTQSRLAKQYDHHLLNQDGKTMYPQAPNPYPFSFASKEFNRPSSQSPR
jgi:hypothetical protein